VEYPKPQRAKVKKHLSKLKFLFRALSLKISSNGPKNLEIGSWQKEILNRNLKEEMTLDPDWTLGLNLKL
jgi:hypothetical protein